MVVIGGLVTGGSYKGDMKGLWGAGDILFFGMGATYMDLLGLWKLIELLTYDMCTFLYVFFNKKVKIHIAHIKSCLNF